MMRLEDGLEHDRVETLLLDLVVSLGLGFHSRPAAGPSFSLLGSAGGSSKLLSRLLSASAAVPLDGSLAPAHVHLLSFACEQAGHVDSPRSSVMGKANGELCVVRLQIFKFLRAEVATDCLCDLFQCPGHVAAVCLASASGPRTDDVILRCGTVCKCTAAIDTSVRDN